MGLNRNINDDSTLAYLFNKTRQGASDALQKAIDAINSAIDTINNTLSSIQTALNNKVSKTGDTMTGNLTLNISGTPKIMLDHKQADTSLATDSAQRVWDFWFRDKNGKAITYLESVLSTAGLAQTGFATRRIVNGSNADNGIFLKVAADGTKSVSVSSPAAWRTAIGAVNIAGDTMTGQLKTSFKQGVAMGSYGSSTSTVPNLCEELRYSSGATGSVSIGTAYTKNGVTIATGWYNFLWMPHRSGGVNGTASGDNCNYGSLYLSGMTVNGIYGIRYASSAIQYLWALGDPALGNLIVSTTTTISSIATAGSNIKISGASYSVWGKVATISINLYDSATTPISSAATIATVVSGKRPATQISLQPAVVSTSSIALLSADLNTDGTVKLRGTSLTPSMGTVTFAGTYIVA